MSQKQKGQRLASTSRHNSAVAVASPIAGTTVDRFRANVFTWTGPGVENIFIDSQLASPTSRARLWRSATLDDFGIAEFASDYDA